MRRAPKITTEQSATLWATVEADSITRFEDESDLLLMSYKESNGSRPRNRNCRRGNKRDS